MTVTLFLLMAEFCSGRPPGTGRRAGEGLQVARYIWRVNASGKRHGDTSHFYA